MVGPDDDTRIVPISDLTVRRNPQEAAAPRAERQPGDNIDIDTAQDLETSPFRPRLRPPTPILWVLDDDQSSGERIRIRVSNFVIGRSDGQLLLPHDTQVSARHAEIERRQEDGRWLFFLRDLNSTNGTYVKIAQSRLDDGAEFRVGRHQFLFTSQRTVVAPDGHASTGPAIVELTAEGEGRAWLLAGREAWIGRDATACWLTIKDPLVDARHARVVSDAKGRWYLDDSNSQNGTWLSIREIQLVSGSEFELGEQRFRIVIP